MKKILVIIIVISIVVFGFYKIAELFSPGSYPYAEKYYIEDNAENVIKAVISFKNDNPQLCPPIEVGLIDGKKNSADHWYHVYFYYHQENQLLNTWIRSSGGRKTVFAFTAVNDGITLGNWKNINKDFSDSENEAQKKKFEERILKKIEAKLGVKYN